jgi:hypothetical protein
MKLSHYLSLFIAMLSCTLVHAENAPEWHGGKSTYVAVDIDAQGKVLDVAPQNTKLAPAVNQALEQAVHGWTFNVTAGKGAATTAKTYLLVRTEMRDDGKNIDLRFVYVGNGPMLEIPPPVYPSSSVSGRAEAALTFTATVTPDGHLTASAQRLSPAVPKLPWPKRTYTRLFWAACRSPAACAVSLCSTPSTTSCPLRRRRKRHFRPA